MQHIFWIALGGSLGAVTRYWVAKSVQSWFSLLFPLGTLFVNSTGSFLIGFLFYGFEQLLVPEDLKAFLLIGFLGAYTTFSTYSLETVNLVKNGEIKMAVLNILISNFLCLLMVIVGMIASHYLLKLIK